jgi:Acetyltransferase (GNAT) domain
LQTPEWAGAKPDWKARSIGWFDGDALVGAGLVLARPVPRIPQRALMYLPEGPDIDWLGEGPTARGIGGPGVPETIYAVSDWLDPMLEYLKKSGGFAVKMGPPVWLARWNAETVKKAIAVAEGHVGSDGRAFVKIQDQTADQVNGRGRTVADQLEALGWLPPDADDALGDYQPKFVFQVPLVDGDGKPLSDDDLMKGFNQLWRRNIKKAISSGVTVERGSEADLGTFHEIFLETAKRDNFMPRPKAYFTRMWRALSSVDPDRIRLYLAKHGDEVHAATLWVRVNGHSWYSYGASTTAGRNLRPSNLVQWHMMRDARDAGAQVYDMRGISSSTSPGDQDYGLTQFKVGTGGLAQEYLGEWDYPLRPISFKAFSFYMSRR